MALERADAVGDGGRGDAELLGGEDEVLVPGGDLEESQAVERREGNHGSGRREPQGWKEEKSNFGFCTNTPFCNAAADSAPPARCFSHTGVHRGCLQRSRGG